MKEMIKKDDLMEAGFAPYTAAGIIRQAPIGSGANFPR